MGYTHYFPQTRKFTDLEWRNIHADATTVLNFCQMDGIALAEEHDNTLPVVVDMYEIRFNGVGEEGHETFHVTREFSHGFNFCKTARKPYDWAVCLVLLICHHHAPGVLEIGSDGDWDNEWQKPRELFQMLLHAEAECPWSQEGVA